MRKQNSEIIRRLEHKRDIRRLAAFVIYMAVIIGLLGIAFLVAKPTFFVD